jgi:tRNA U38,U39,U40 pseudouridine synthase TruA
MLMFASRVAVLVAPIRLSVSRHMRAKRTRGQNLCLILPQDFAALGVLSCFEISRVHVNEFDASLIWGSLHAPWPPGEPNRESSLAPIPASMCPIPAPHRLRGMLGRGLGASREQLSALSRDDLIELVCSADQMLASRSIAPAGAPPPAVTEAAPAAALPVEPASAATESERGRKRRSHSPRLFDMSRYGQRWVALRLAYVGTKYSGMQYAEDVETIEGALFDALTKTRLITSKDDCGFSRGGRTDRGVSALGQVVALRLRSSVVPPPVTGEAAGVGSSGTGGAVAGVCSTGAGGLPFPDGEHATLEIAEAALAASLDASMDVSGTRQADAGPIPAGDSSTPTPTDAVPTSTHAVSTLAGSAPPTVPVLPPTAGEMDYVRVLNRVLPADIRVISWAPVPPEWSARFAASSRTYHYFFARSHYDLEAMREGARRLVGAHDYRNFCKLDPAVNSFQRAIHSFEIRPVDGLRVHDGGVGGGAPGGIGGRAAWTTDATTGRDGGELGAESLLAPWVFVINGSAFLWHQVRCGAPQTILSPCTARTLLPPLYSPHTPYTIYGWVFLWHQVRQYLLSVHTCFSSLARSPSSPLPTLKRTRSLLHRCDHWLWPCTAFPPPHAHARALSKQPALPPSQSPHLHTRAPSRIGAVHGDCLLLNRLRPRAAFPQIPRPPLPFNIPIPTRAPPLPPAVTGAVHGRCALLNRLWPRASFPHRRSPGHPLSPRQAHLRDGSRRSLTPLLHPIPRPAMDAPCTRYTGGAGGGMGQGSGGQRTSHGHAAHHAPVAA